MDPDRPAEQPVGRPEVADEVIGRAVCGVEHPRTAFDVEALQSTAETPRQRTREAPACAGTSLVVSWICHPD